MNMSDAWISAGATIIVAIITVVGWILRARVSKKSELENAQKLKDEDREYEMYVELKNKVTTLRGVLMEIDEIGYTRRFHHAEWDGMYQNSKKELVDYEDKNRKLIRGNIIEMIDEFIHLGTLKGSKLRSVGYADEKSWRSELEGMDEIDKKIRAVFDEIVDSC